MRRRPGWEALAIVTGASIFLAGCSGGASGTGGAGGAGSGTPQRGGTMTYLLGGVLASWSRGLDPATAGLAPSIILDAIFGRLFRLGDGGKIEPDLASGYEISDDGKTVTISLREGVKFQDGTPFNAEAVAWNIERDLEAACVCSPVTSWPPLSSEGVTTPDEHTVMLHFTRPYAAVIAMLISSSVNRIASPTAVRKMGEQQFSQKPVGAGPFEVVSNVVNSEVELKRYDGYWKKGRPYLDGLIFKTIGGDQPAYQAIQAGQVQATQMTTPAIIRQASKNANVTVTPQNGTSPWLIQLNTSIPPFDDKLAREAIYYATDVNAIRTHLFYNMYPATQSFTGPGGLFYQPQVPGYRTYDPAKAKQIVSQLGGLKVDLFGGADQAANQTLQVLQNQWAEVGIEATIHPYQLDRQIQEFEGRKWQAALQSNGAFDPGMGAGLPFRFGSEAVYTGVHDSKLDTMIGQAAATLDENERARMYAEIAKYISDQAYAPFLLAPAPAAVTADGVHGPGLTSKVSMTSVTLLPYWDEVWMEER
ncbi:MAG: ABC transporter substrate-binding protein [Streptosporangiales bacterium]|nr:ABC transporter substrate-binding protein [Streptosporangiales bacterium]